MAKHPQWALSAIGVRKITRAGYHADGNGLYLQVTESGAKSWIVRTTINGRRREIGIGGLSYTPLVVARDRAAEIRGVARNGGDPLAERRASRKAAARENGIPTFEVAARAVHAEHSKAFRNPKHAAQWIDTLERFAFPVLGPRRVDGIESKDVLAVLQPIWSKIPETADRVRQRMRTVFAWTNAAGHRTAGNPVEGITKILSKQNRAEKHFAAMPFVDVPAFLRALRTDAGVSSRLAFEFMILTASRTGEVIKAQWSEIDIERAVWNRPADHMKAKREHKVPLSKRCLEILAEAKKITDGGDYIFPGMKVKQPLSNVVFHSVLRRMEVKGITPHGFRSAFRDWAEEKTPHTRRTIEESLAHVVRDKTEAAYLRTELLEKRQALMADWERFCCAASSAKVVSIGRGRR